MAAGQGKRSLCGAGAMVGERGTLGSGPPVLTAFGVGRGRAWVILDLDGAPNGCLQNKVPDILFEVAVILSFLGEETKSQRQMSNFSLGHRVRGSRAELGHFQASLNSQYSFLMLWGRELGLIPATAGGPLVLWPDQEPCT